MSKAPTPPELRGKDERGNVRPADDRFLSSSDKRKRDRYVKAAREHVAKARAEAQEKAAAKREAPAEEEAPADG